MCNTPTSQQFDGGYLIFGESNESPSPLIFYRSHSFQMIGIYAGRNKAKMVNLVIGWNLTLGLGVKMTVRSISDAIDRYLAVAMFIFVKLPNPAWRLVSPVLNNILGSRLSRVVIMDESHWVPGERSCPPIAERCNWSWLAAAALAEAGRVRRRDGRPAMVPIEKPYVLVLDPSNTSRGVGGNGSRPATSALTQSRWVRRFHVFLALRLPMVANKVVGLAWMAAPTFTKCVGHEFTLSESVLL